MLKAYNHVEELDRDTLVDDEEFINDASAFLRDRVGYDSPMTSGEIYDKFMEHMRFQDSNEVTAIRDLEYAQNADLEGKQRFGRLMDAYDKVDDFGVNAVLDYAEAIARAPSTYAGIITGGVGKLATTAGTQAVKLGIRKTLSSTIKDAAQTAVKEGMTSTVLKGATKAAAVEGALGLGQGAVQEGTRVTTGIQEEFTGGRTLAQGIGSAVGAGVLNLPIGLGTTVMSKRANELAEQADLAATELAKIASKRSKEELAKAGNKDKAKKVRGILDALNPNDVALGRKLKKDMSGSESVRAELGPEVVDNIAAAYIRVGDAVNLQPGQRITEAVSNAIANDKLDLTQISNILREHNLNLDQFSLVYTAELSDAGRTLGVQSKLVKSLIKNMDNLNRGGVSAMSGKEADALVKANETASLGKKFMQGARDLDRLSIASMTVQAATTMRNTIGGGFRGAIDATHRTMDNGIEIALGKKAPQNLFSGTGDLSYYMLNPYEGKVIRNLFEKEFPEEAKRLFRDNADIDYRTGKLVKKDKDGNLVVKDASGKFVPYKEPAMNVIGKKINVLNTMSDNMFKQAMLSASLSRSMKDQGIDLAEVITTGNFKNIPTETYQKAIKDAYEFTYQSNFKTKGDEIFGGFAKAGTWAQEKFPFVFSSFMPFPRFVANQLKFQYDHIPLLGFTDAILTGSKARAREQLPKQLAGASALSMAYAWRVQQGPEAEWFEIDKGDGNYINGKAIYGPIAPFMVAADIFYRYKNIDGAEVPQEWGKYYSKAILEATLGSTFRTGLGLAGIEKLYETGISNPTANDIAEWAGNTLGRFTIPAGVLKDFYGQVDPQARMIPATRTGEEDYFDIVGRAFTRNLPDLPMSTLSGGALPVLDYDTPAKSPYLTGPMTAVNPIEKQLFGATTTKKSPLMQEMSRLGMSYGDIYTRDKSDKIDFYTRQELSREGSPYNLNERLANYMSTDSYAKAQTPEEKVTFLKELGKGLVAEAKDIAKIRIRREAKRQGKPYSKVEIAEWSKVSQTIRDRIDRIFDEEFGVGDGTMTVEDYKDSTLFIGDRKINVLMWAVQALDNLPKARDY